MRKTLLTMCLIMLLSLTTTAQSQTFRRYGLDYALDLPSPAWRAVRRIDVHRHFEFINGDVLIGRMKAGHPLGHEGHS